MTVSDLGTRTSRGAWIRANRTKVTVLAILAFLFITALQGLERDTWFATVMQGLSVGAITFLVASGLSLIFGLMDVLNLAHGEIFMLGAYVGWTIYTRFDTALDVMTPLFALAAPFALLPLWRRLAGPVRALLTGERSRKVVPWLIVGGGAAVAMIGVTRFPLVIWDPEVYAQSPITFSLAIDLGTLAPLPADSFAGSPVIAYLLVLAGGAVIALGSALLRSPSLDVGRIDWRHPLGFVAALAASLILLLGRGAINDWVFGLSTTWRFALAVVFAVAVGVVVGMLIEVLLIRPLYERPIYQLMITLGVGFIIIETVREVWGRPEFTMPRPAAFNATGAGCPGEGFTGLFSGCATVDILGGRIRTYNELFVVTVGIVVLVGVTLLLKRSRIGMVIRAGVQDAEMVEALGINVRRVFTIVFGLGSGLAALGGVLAAPSIGLSASMGSLLLLSALVALAIGGLTSFPGAAAGAVLVGLLQQFIIRFGQTGISIPGMAEPFKPSPTVVPAAAVFLMVVILLVLPKGLFGRSER